MKNRGIKFASPVLIAAVVGGVLWVNAGQLTPPIGAITATGPTTLNQADIGAGPLFTLSASGSYILTSDIVAPGGFTDFGILVSADNVTLNMNGFALIGVPGSLDGISNAGIFVNISIYNGTVRNWGANGVQWLLGKNGQYKDLGAYDNGISGLVLGTAAVATGCTSARNGGVGISVGQGSTVTGCTATENSGNGIDASESAAITGCAAYSNGGDGISAGEGSVVNNCSAVSNIQDGISISFGEVRGCTSYNNTGDGIQAGFDCTVIGNTCMKNSALGISLTGRRSRIEGNNVLENGAGGIGGGGIKNLIIKNSAARNTLANYSLAADNAVGEIVDVTGTGGVPFTSGSPWANFVYELSLP